MKRRVLKWLLVTGGVLVVLAVALQIALVRGFSYEQVIARELPLRPDLILTIEGQVIQTSIARAFFASRHGGLHGDGTAVTAYRLAPNEVNNLAEVMKQKTPQFTWEERVARFSSLTDVEKLLPDFFRAHPDERLLHGAFRDPTIGGAYVTEYYIDRQRGTLYVVVNTF